MSKFFHLSKKSNAPAKTQRLKMRGAISIRMLNLTVISLLLVVGVSYLVQVNSLVTKGYAIKDLENRVDELKKQSNELELQVLDLQSMETVKNKVTQLDMVAIGEVDYLSVTPVARATQ